METNELTMDDLHAVVKVREVPFLHITSSKSKAEVLYVKYLSLLKNGENMASNTIKPNDKTCTRWQCLA